MNKKILAILINSVLLLSGTVFAADKKADPTAEFGGFAGEKRSKVKLKKWKCEYCTEVEKWEVKLDTHIGITDDTSYNFGNYSGIDNSSQLFFSGSVKMQDEDSRYWNTYFQNIGLDSAGFQSSYGQKGNYDFKLDFQRIPVRKYEHLNTLYTAPGSTNLVLNNDWVHTDNKQQFANYNNYNQFKMGSDWDRINLSFNMVLSDHFDFETTYSRLDKEGTREFSATHMIDAVYLPFPVDQTTEEFGASMSFMADKWFASLSGQVSKFSNAIDSVTFSSPFLPLVNGSDQGTMSTAPDNLSMTMVANARYFYAPKSSAKVSYTLSRLTQDQAFLPYTTNPNLMANLPEIDLDGEVVTQDLNVQLHHWINSQFTVRAKYRNRQRDNNTDRRIYQPVMTELYTDAEIMNLPYDFEKESGFIQLEYRPLTNHLLSLKYKTEDKTRNYQSVRTTSEAGFIAKYRSTISENLVLMLKGEQLDRDGSAPLIYDYLAVKENPLMQRYNVSDRSQNKLNFQVLYRPFENFSTSISGYYKEQDYKKTEIGLTYNEQENINLDFNWAYDKSTSLTLFMQKEKVNTDMMGSNTFSTPDWSANNLDEVNSYGFSFLMKHLLDDKLEIFVEYNRSDADTNIMMNTNNSSDLLPEINSVWNLAELKAKYLYSKDLSFSLSYQNQKFESNDFTIDNAMPGDINRLLTFGALSNNYNINLLLLTASYKF